MAKKIKAIFFDLDNTLINRDAAFASCLLDFYIFFPELSIDLQLILKKDNAGYTPRKEFYEWLTSTYPNKDYQAKDIHHYIIQNISRYLTPTEEVLHLLTTLSEKYQLAILTNGSIYNQSQKIKNTRLDSIFNVNQVYISQAYRTAKPNPTLFQVALQEWKLSPNEILFIGDNPIHDILGASQVGLNTCWVSHDRTWSEDFKYDFKIENIMALPKIMTEYGL